MSEIKQLVEEFLEKFSVSKFLSISPYDAQANVDFFSDFALQKEKFEKLMEKALIECDYEAIADASPLSILFGSHRDAVRMLKNQITKGEAGIYAKAVDIEKMTDALTKSINTFHQYLTQRPQDLSVYHVNKNISTSTYIVNGLVQAQKTRGETFHFPKYNYQDLPIASDALMIFEDYSDDLYKTLTGHYLSEFQKHEGNEEALQEPKQKFQDLLEKLVGFKSYIAKNFVLSGPPTRFHSTTNLTLISYKKRIDDFQSVLSGVNHITHHGYLTVLDVLEKSNEQEKNKLKEKGIVSVNYFERDADKDKNTYIKSINIDMSGDKGFVECLKDTLKDNVPIEVAYSIIAHQQGEFEVGDKKIHVEQHDAFNSGAQYRAIVSAIEKDKELGVDKETHRSIQFVSPTVLANPFGGLDETRPVVEQITTHMQKVLTVGFLPSFKDIPEHPDPKTISKFLKVTECKVAADAFKQLVDRGLKLDIYHSPNDIHDGTININGLSPFYFNHADCFSPSVTSPEIVKEFNKIGLSKGFVDALDKFSNISWHTDMGHMREMSGQHFKKLFNLSLTEVAKGKADGIENFLNATGKLYPLLNDITNSIERNRQKPLHELFTKTFCSDVYDVLNGMKAQDFVDKNGTSPLIRLINELNRVKNENPYSAPIFAKNEQGEYQLVSHADREKTAILRMQKNDAEMFYQWGISGGSHHSGRNLPVSIYYETKWVSNRTGEFLNLCVPKKFFEGDNVKALIQGKDENGNNILHHLLQNPSLFYSVNDRVNEENVEYEKGERLQIEQRNHSATIKRLTDIFSINGSHVLDLNRDSSNISHFVKQIPKEDIERLALEKNNAGRTPIEELCYFAEFIKENAQTSFSISKAYNELLDSVLDISGFDTSSKFEMLRKPPEFLNPPSQYDVADKMHIDDFNPKHLVADVVQENLGNVLRYLYSLNSISEQYDFKTTINTSNISTPSLEYKIMKGDGAVKKAMTKLPL